MGNFQVDFAICFTTNTWPFLIDMSWLTPHFDGNCTIFLANTILFKTNENNNFVNMASIINE